MTITSLSFLNFIKVRQRALAGNSLWISLCETCSLTLHLIYKEVNSRVAAQWRWGRTPGDRQVEDRVRQLQMKPFTKTEFPSRTPSCYLGGFSSAACTLTNTHQHAYSPVHEHTVPLMHQRVLPSVTKVQKGGGLFVRFIFCAAPYDVICVLAPLISIQLKTTTRPRYTVAFPGGRHRQTYS